MKIDGEVTTGLGKAAYFLSQDFYTKEFKKNLGFVPYPGTLNIIVGEEFLDEINEIKNNCENLIKLDQGFGAVKYIEAKLCDEIKSLSQLRDTLLPRLMSGELKINEINC